MNPRHWPLAHQPVDFEHGRIIRLTRGEQHFKLRMLLIHLREEGFGSVRI